MSAFYPEGPFRDPGSESIIRADTLQDRDLLDQLRSAVDAIKRHRCVVVDLKRVRTDMIAAGEIEACISIGSFQSGTLEDIKLSFPAELAKFEINRQLESRRSEYRKSLIALRDAIISELESL